jgi:hypothetical protein
MKGKKKVTIVSEVKEDGRLYLNFEMYEGDSGPTKFELLSIMVSGLVMTTKIACEGLDHKTQGKMIKDVFDLLKSDLFDYDSFKDLEIKMEEL